MLIEDVLIDQTGWETGYDYNLSASKPQAPSKFSHNFYIQKDVTDLIFRDNVSMRGAEAGAQIRSGGLIEGNVFIANDTAFNVGIGNGDQVAGARQPGDARGLPRCPRLRRRAGLGHRRRGAEHLVCRQHRRPPHRPDGCGRARHPDAIPASRSRTSYTPLTDDTIVYNWETETKSRPDIKLPAGVSPSVLEATTIKSFVEDVLGRNGGTDGVAALATWLKQNWHSSRSEADLILDYFQSAFRPGTGPTKPPAGADRAGAETGAGTRAAARPGRGLTCSSRHRGPATSWPATRGDDLILSLGGAKDVINAGGGADVFLFGDETTNGKAEIDRIHNFQARQRRDRARGRGRGGVRSGSPARTP